MLPNICAILEKYLQKTVNYCKIKSIYKIVKQNKRLRVQTFVLFLAHFYNVPLNLVLAVPQPPLV